MSGLRLLIKHYDTTIPACWMSKLGLKLLLVHAAVHDMSMLAHI